MAVVHLAIIIITHYITIPRDQADHQVAQHVCGTCFPERCSTCGPQWYRFETLECHTDTERLSDIVNVVSRKNPIRVTHSCVLAGEVRMF